MKQGDYPQALEAVIHLLGRLPGIGRRTAERLALAMMEWPEDRLQDLGRRLETLQQSVTACTCCGNLAEADLCRICSDSHRDRHLVCIVEDAAQIPVFERSRSYRGLYHVLGGRLLPLEGKGPEQLRIRELEDRLQTGDITEIIIATGSDVEGEATASYLREILRRENLTVSRIAFGVPVGADLSYADPATIAMAINTRRTP
jgi:recombination protein RecR